MPQVHGDGRVQVLGQPGDVARPIPDTPARLQVRGTLAGPVWRDDPDTGTAEIRVADEDLPLQAAAGEAVAEKHGSAVGGARVLVVKAPSARQAQRRGRHRVSSTVSDDGADGVRMM